MTLGFFLTFHIPREYHLIFAPDVPRLSIAFIVIIIFFMSVIPSVAWMRRFRANPLCLINKSFSSKTLFIFSMYYITSLIILAPLWSEEMLVVSYLMKLILNYMICNQVAKLAKPPPTYLSRWFLVYLFIITFFKFRYGFKK